MKKWYKSKLIWLGIISLVYSLLQFFGIVNGDLTEATKTAIIAVLVILFRAITKDPLFNFE